MGSLLQDLVYAVRALRRTPGFAVIAVLTLALGIGVNAAVFSVVYAVLLHPLPFRQPEQLALIWPVSSQTAAYARSSDAALRELREHASLLAEVGGLSLGSARIAVRNEEVPEEIPVARVSGNFLRMLGVQPVRGRIFAPEEELNARPLAVMSNGFWRRFGADPDIVGKCVHFNGGECLTAIGVLPENFQLYFPAGAGVPSEIPLFYLDPNRNGSSNLVARLKPGVSFIQAQQQMEALTRELQAVDAPFAAGKMRLRIASVHDEAVRDLRPALLALFAGAAFVFLICCVNVVNLLLARANDRRKEVAIRSALGASQGRVIRLLLTEGALLCSLAGAAALAMAWAAIRLFVHGRPDSLARAGEIGLSWPVLAFVAAVSIACVLLFGLAPGIESAKAELSRALRDGGRTSFTGARRGVCAALIVSEVTLGFVLVVGAGLMIRTLDQIQRVRPGFEPRRLLTFRIGGFGGPTLFNFIKDSEAKLLALPGVEAVGETSILPLDDYPNSSSPYRPEGAPGAGAFTLTADSRSVTPGFLRAMGTRLLEGRNFNEQDGARGLPVVMVDELLAAATWPGESAIGKRLESERLTEHGLAPVWAEVVGVVGHAHNHSLTHEPRGEIYIPFEQSPPRPFSYAVRTRVDPLTLAGPIRRLLHGMIPHASIGNMRPMTEYVEAASAPAALAAMLAGGFGAIALALAAIGIYGVSYYSVSRRMHEMGVRMALGARGSDLVRMVMREGLVLTATGMAIGIAGALALSRQLQALIYGISATDPLTYGLAIVAIPAAAIIGCWRPAARAASANPVDAIRSE